MSNESRELSPVEARVVQMTRTIDEYLKEHRLTIRLSVNFDMANLLGQYHNANIAKILKSELISGQEKYNIVYTLSEFQKYVNHIAHKAGIQYGDDGSFRLRDGIIIKSEEIYGDE